MSYTPLVHLAYPDAFNSVKKRNKKSILDILFQTIVDSASSEWFILRDIQNKNPELFSIQHESDRKMVVRLERKTWTGLERYYDYEIEFTKPNPRFYAFERAYGYGVHGQKVCLAEFKKPFSS